MISDVLIHRLIMSIQRVEVIHLLRFYKRATDLITVSKSYSMFDFEETLLEVDRESRVLLLLSACRAVLHFISNNFLYYS